MPAGPAPASPASPWPDFLLAWSGVYNIAASRGHWAIVEWFLRIRHEQFGRAPRLEHRQRRRSTIRICYSLGAGALPQRLRALPRRARNAGRPDDAARCRRRPTFRTSPREWKDRELFWIVKHGIKYTGMPAWVVAGARRRGLGGGRLPASSLPDLDAAAYRALAIGACRAADAERPRHRGGRVSAGRGRRLRALPRRGGARAGERPGAGAARPAGANSCVAALARLCGRRRAQSGIMQPVAAELDAGCDRQARRLLCARCRHRRRIGERDRRASSTDASSATAGDAGREIPPCTGCHDAEALPTYPRLAGQNAAYMANRLRLWKKRLAAVTRTAEAIMAPIARLLSEQQIDAGVGLFRGAAACTRTGAAAMKRAV